MKSGILWIVSITKFLRLRQPIENHTIENPTVHHKNQSINAHYVPLKEQCGIFSDI